MGRLNLLFSELRRRHVFKVAAAYGVAAWLLVEVSATTFPVFGAPAWVLKVVITLAVVGFPLAVALAWAFDLTPGGVRRAEPVSTLDEPAHARGRPPVDSRVAGSVGVGMLMGLVSVGAYSWTRLPSTAAEMDAGVARSLAVLPFTGVGGGAENEYFSEGISEEILNALSQVEGLRVAARTSAFSFKGESVSVDSIARALNVAHVLEGSVRSAGDRVRISAQLVNTGTGHQTWSHSYDRELKDVLAVQEEIAVAIANALRVRLAGKETQLTRSYTPDPEAYELYLQGRHLVSKRTPEDLKRAVARFEAALVRDPAYAAAYSGLADAYALLEDVRGMTREEAFPRAIAAATRALELDELQGEAHASLGHIYYHQKNWAGAEEAYQRALELIPSYATAHHWYGNLLAATNRLPEAVQSLERAYQLDPLSPKIREVRSYTLYYARQYDRAIASMHERLRSDPDDPGILYILAWFQSGAGKHDEAIATMQRVIERVPSSAANGWARTRLAAAYAAAGRPHDAIPLLEALEQGPPGEANESVMAVAYGHLDDFDRAFQWLGRAVDRGHWMVSTLAVDPAFDPLRRDPRFADMVQRAEQVGS